MNLTTSITNFKIVPIENISTIQKCVIELQMCKVYVETTFPLGFVLWLSFILFVMGIFFGYVTWGLYNEKK
jgi:hemolysin-activating ACP:hemolysin acyltransferase